MPSRKRIPVAATTRLAAYLTWRQLDLLLLLNEGDWIETPDMTESLRTIQQWDEKHGGAYYGEVRGSVYATLRNLENRGLAQRVPEVARHRTVSWEITQRGRRTVEAMEDRL